jgi:Double zinc ribbon
MGALIIGTLLAVGALAFVLFPLFADTPAPRLARRAVRGDRVEESEAIVALREIEFDRETGKLAQADYDELRARYTERALVEMRRDAASSIASPDELLEAAVAEARARLKECATCGPRPEPDAVFCSNCGEYLPGQCVSCGVHVDEKGASFCAHCGRSLAA